MAPPVAGAPSRRRRPRWLAIVFVALLCVPLVEIAVIIAVGRVIGGWPTFLLLLVESLIGAWFVRREGSRAWTALQTALTDGPDAEPASWPTRPSSSSAAPCCSPPGSSPTSSASSSSFR